MVSQIDLSRQVDLTQLLMVLRASFPGHLASSRNAKDPFMNNFKV
jgi:hypothetical protein